MSGSVFVLGSGFSKEVAGYPTLQELSLEIGKWITECNEPEANFIKNNVSNEIQNNLEHLLSYLWIEQPWHDVIDQIRAKAAYVFVTRQLQNIFASRKVPDFNDSHLALAKSWDKSRSMLITFNYDTVIEKLALQLGKVDLLSDLYCVAVAPLHSRNQGFGHGTIIKPKFHLLKLHGSLNWFYTGDASYAGQPIYYTHSSQLQLPEEHQDLAPIIIPPVMDKNRFYFHNALKHQWRLAKKSIQEAEHVFFIGYSIPSTDFSIQFFLKEAFMQSKAKVFVIVKESDSEQANEIKVRYEKIFKGGLVQFEFKNATSPSLTWIQDNLNKLNINK